MCNIRKIILAVLMSVWAQALLFGTFSADIRGRVTPEKAQLDLAVNHLFRKGDYHKALKELQRFRELFPRSMFTSRSLYYSAMSNAILGNLDEAIAGYRNIIERYPHSMYHPKSVYRIAGVYRKAAEGHMHANKHEEALKSLEMERKYYDQFLRFKRTKTVYRHDLALYHYSESFLETHRVLGKMNKKGETEIEDAEKGFKFLIDNYTDSQRADAAKVQLQVVHLFKNPIKDVAHENKLKEMQAAIDKKDEALKTREAAVSKEKEETTKAQNAIAEDKKALEAKRKEFDEKLKKELEAIQALQEEIKKEQNSIKEMVKSPSGKKSE